MQLDEIREKYTIKEISYLTNISEENLIKLFEKDFKNIRKINALGFISILAREYKADLVDLDTEAREYYAQFTPERTANLGITKPMLQQPQEKPKIFFFVILALLAYSTWYFLTQFDKNNLSKLMPFIEDSTIERFVSNPEINQSIESSLMIGNTIEAAKTNPKVIKVEKTESIVLDSNNSKEEKTEEVTEKLKIEEQSEEENTSKPKESAKQVHASIIPHNRLWFGIINTSTKKRDHFSVAEPYSIDISEATWLIATSSASFSLKLNDKKEDYKDSKEHYFSINKEEIKSLSKAEYVALGGWEKW
jgi:hypothetical protein